MQRSERSWGVPLRALLTVFLLALVSAPAFAQGGGATSAIAGVVVDTSGGVIPGATVTATNVATAGNFTAVTAGNGSFTIPALNVGKYDVTVTLQGFKSAVLKDVEVTSGGPATLRVTLEVGGLAETVTVEGATEVVQTQSASVATTINTKQIMSLPLSRDLLNGGLVTFLPGVMTPGGTRDSIINGLPQSSINITLDGVSIQDNHLKTSDGFFARVSPRLDAIEEVTVTTAASGTDASGMGATQIKFTTRSGSNQFNASSYYYFQHEKLNTNTYFNKVRGLPKNAALLHQPGTRVGGPVVIPGLYDGRGKMFFFVNYEESRSPRTADRTTDFLTSEAYSGLFRYQTATGVVTRDLYVLAAAAGHIATPDPVIANLLAVMRGAITSNSLRVEDLAGNFTAQRYRWQDKTNNNTYYPTVRLDYNLSTAHKLTGSWNFTNLKSRPDTTNTQQRTYPGFPIWGSQLSKRYTFQTTLRSTLGANIVNELRYGMSGGATNFSPDKATGMWSDPAANQNGFGLSMSGLGITPAGSGTTTSAREASTKFVENNLTWLQGAHTVTLGGQFTSADVWLANHSRVPGMNFGVVTGDPASGMFNTTNFPGSSSAQRTAAQNMYATLVGRISSITGTARLDPATLQYVYLGSSLQEGRLPELDFYIQDNWKARPNLTVSAGLRYVLQFPFRAKNGSYSTATLDDVWGLSGNVPGCNPSAPTAATCNLFKPGTTPGVVSTYQNLGKGVKAYNTDWDNVAPSIGINWTPSAETGWLRTLLGRPGDSALSGGWSRSYERHGMSDFTGVFGSNPGITQVGDRTLNNGNLLPAGSTFVLFRNGYLGPPAFCSAGVTPPACIPEAPIYPIPSNVTGSVNTFDPNLQVPFSDSWTVGFQRAVSRTSAIEIRYVGTRNREQWTTYNMNETNIHENGFLQEFRNAQANLYAHIAQGCTVGSTCSFAYRGAGTGTVPLPIYLAYLVGSTNATSSAAYSGTNWTNATFVNPLNRFNPNVFTAASGLNGQASFRANALTAGLPRNFFVANPDALGGANVTGYGGYTKYNGLQLQFRRRLSAGLQWDANYATGKAYESSRYSFRVDRKLTRQTGTEGDVAHAFKTTFVYELPFGQGRRFASGVGPWMDRLVGGWQMAGTARLQTGRLVDLGNIRIVGMSDAEVRKAFRLRRVGPNEIYMWPEDIIDNTIKAYSRDLTGYTLGEPTGRYFAPANGIDCMETISNGYGDCGLRSFVIQAPIFRTMDLNIVKMIPLAGRRSLEIRIDALNVFDTVNFTPVTGIGSTVQSGYQITGATSGRVVQLVTRVNW